MIAVLQVVAHNLGTNADQTVLTDGSGYYRITRLQLGEYTISMNIAGFSPYMPLANEPTTTQGGLPPSVSITTNSGFSMGTPHYVPRTAHALSERDRSGDWRHGRLGEGQPRCDSGLRLPPFSFVQRRCRFHVLTFPFREKQLGFPYSHEVIVLGSDALPGWQRGARQLRPVLS